MILLPYILIGICVLFGFSFVLFAFVNPPYFLSSLYFTPSFLYFMGERTGRVFIGILFGLVGPLLISMFML